jgi:hypothetical protein
VFFGPVALNTMCPERWPPEMVTLEITDTFRPQQRRVLGVLDAFGHRGQTEAVDETEQMAEKDPTLRPAPQILNQGAVDLDDVDWQDLKMPQRGVAGAKIVECDAASGIVQRVDKAHRFGDVTQGRSLRDLDDEAACDVAAVAQQRNQRPQPRAIAGSHPGYVQTKPDLGISGKVLHRFFENVAVDQADPTEFLDNGDELATGDDTALLVAHPQQAFKIVDGSRRRADHRLKRKEQAVLAQRRLHRRPDGHSAPLAE